ncbi:hypothetical protein NQ314_002788 [Rhamnusium bicolor]|uniref:Mitochondrial basic amino acids transporter n=1 Tax=Rhamnusium bicolor TaxID=1586634 RepID=A0AAV8ZPE3_9CUCU|nr:hypothetical protein NQ314_002788 [Rhamnusium bicolor]
MALWCERNELKLNTGMAGVIVGHPLDTVKVHLQTQNMNNPKYKGTIHCLRSLLVKEGLKGVYRGVTSPPYGSCWHKRHCQKNRLQVNKSASKGPVDCLREIYVNDGIKGVFKGCGVTIGREVPAFGVYFFTYELLTRSENNVPISTWNMILAGGLAGVASWIAIYPIDVIKSKMQVDGISSPQYTNSYDCLKKSIKNGGVSCLFRGLTPTLIRAFPVNAVTFTVVTWTMRILSGDGLKETESILERYADVVCTLKVTENSPS